MTIAAIDPRIVDAPAAPGGGATLSRWAGVLVSGAILAAVVVEIANGGLASFAEVPPRAPAFWLLLAAVYLVLPVADWAIYRRLWGLPAAAIGVLLRKQVANELVLGYSGDAQLYLWARRHVRAPRAPLAAVKDAAILSAVAGNVVTLVLMVLSARMLVRAVHGPLVDAFLLSVGVIAASSLALFVLRRALFTLSPADLRFVFVGHVARILLYLALLAALAHTLLPDLTAQQLLVLVTLRMMLSRLPLLPAKDAVFAGLVAVLFGKAATIVPAILLIGSLLIAAHIVVGIAATVGVAGVDSARRAARAL